jgi:hypothetical protein
MRKTGVWLGGFVVLSLCYVALQWIPARGPARSVERVQRSGNRCASPRTRRPPPTNPPSSIDVDGSALPRGTRLTERPASSRLNRHARLWRRQPNRARFVSSVAIISVEWSTSTSWQPDRVFEPFRVRSTSSASSFEYLVRYEPPPLMMDQGGEARELEDPERQGSPTSTRLVQKSRKSR